MLDERKVKLMTKMALYEQKEGKEDFKVSAYYRKDYASVHTIYSILWMTVGYILLIVLIGFAAMDSLTANMTLSVIVLLTGSIIIGYFLVVFIGGVASHQFYNNKHQEARSRVKKYNHHLIRLLKMYEKEKR
ncbi:hypothetical protein OCV99_01605 [Dorea acetigenes]|jgi:uncharacterized integral membrane protein|uniref:Uncharacterized protein n=1 Tax=Dorea acetigenes TaxID=2981787 RepID=A0ABT2RIM5_9FIRM|nr:hypothetical protein [Dorea acetigenes]MCB6414474.1 hypothetical protein [Faecalimonas umbilicata]MCU6685259.1 hypothetical protein [Dorea acetigenes]SCI41970.1 Uncharacterised protein [uncultured Clostridium sp.]